MKPFVIHSQATGKAKINKRNVDLKKKKNKKMQRLISTSNAVK